MSTRNPGPLKKSVTPEVQAKIRKLQKEGLGTSVIAIRLGLRPITVRRYFEREK